ncbi:hypothetical protein PLICRDRAFT_39078 [Plicaturopsis crispa FD-325 SS-3]|nr:hypothetical protein PLICRDRAFT_39078 [Plicaturopsis crispa FD-325 SS-3]
MSPSVTANPALLFAQKRTDSTFEQIPIIDLANASSPDPAARRALADTIRDACINVGFFYVSNHSIPNPVIACTIHQAKQFFALPDQDKLALDIHKTPNYKGYTALLGENTNAENKGDVHEGFDIGWEDERGGHRGEDGAMEGVNVWPDNAALPRFREDVLAYYHAAVRLGLSLFPLFALALNLPEDFFADKTKNPAAILRLLHYPPQTGPVDERVIGIGAHTDYECFTILYQDTVPALQVLNTAGHWVDAVPVVGTLVINLGDQFARWTNDVFKSTVHRAINRTGVERYSIPLFFGVDYDVPLEVRGIIYQYWVLDHFMLPLLPSVCLHLCL